MEPLSRLFRGKFRAALHRTDLFGQVPASVWRQEWVVHCQPVGPGETALKYLAPYIFRVALSNHRIVKLQASQVTFHYRERDTRRWKRCTLPVEEFIRLLSGPEPCQRNPQRVSIPKQLCPPA